MPNRILKESICTSDSIDGLSKDAEIFFYRLIVQCDDFGRFDARPSVLRARCFPLRLESVTDALITLWLNELVATNTVQVYQVDGKPFLQFLAWDEHQQVRAKRSKYPAPKSSDSNGNHLQSSDSTCARNPIQSESYSESESNPNPNPDPARAMDDDDAMPYQNLDPNIQAIRNAYDACGILFSKTHQDAHLETIKRTSLRAWQMGFAAAMEKGKHNVPDYVARCAESVMLTEQAQRTGHGTNGNGAKVEKVEYLPLPDGSYAKVPVKP
jgi:hypothetical protein